MAINLASKYAKELAQAFSQKSVVDGVACKDYEFTGVKNLKVYTAISQPLNDYKRSGNNRYGEPQEAQDTVQDMVVEKDRSFSITVDKGNNSEQMGTKEASKILNIEMSEQAIPEMDRYALRKFIDYAGTLEEAAEEPSEENIVKMISDGMVKMGNKKVPPEGRYIFIGWSLFGMLRLSKQFIGVEALAKEALVKGAVGTFMGAQVVTVPDDYLMKGENRAYFLIVYRNSVLQPKKVQDYFIKENPAGINGALIEGRFIYDAFVIGAKCDGVYAVVEKGTVQPAPTFSLSGSDLSVTSSGANKIRITTDGTDPRFSDSAFETTSGGKISLPAGKIIAKAVAFDEELFTSSVAEDIERTIA
ncbi:MAG: chitobiase/beta-hexosaminidase C-terminal domain-containing protein [Oscillospiraceae bacterium]|nr:chitobiase/beta-hexosaminidase C-terminal domain-containing protein [Oscillospiraceae bacterium]MBR3611328.1 chitobiase/beta-hexosaminidase C-terminal domain-containing protein [Oscillospiraceae bacterium]